MQIIVSKIFYLNSNTFARKLSPCILFILHLESCCPKYMAICKKVACFSRTFLHVITKGHVKHCSVREHHRLSSRYLSPTVPFVYFRTVEIDIKHPRKILTSLFREVMASSASFWLRYYCKVYACHDFFNFYWCLQNYLNCSIRF